MAIQIKLKEKYRRGFKGRYKGGERPAPPKRRKKIGHAEHVKRQGEQPLVRLIVEGRRGTGLFVKE